MEKKAIAQVRKSKLQKLFRQLQAGAFPKKRLKFSQCELTIIKDQVTLNTPWAQFSLDAETIGTAKATFPLLDISNVVKTFSSVKLILTVTENIIQFGSFSVKSNTCFFEDDKILRSIVLPVNNNESDLVRLLNGRYTKEELEFNKLWTPAINAENRFNSAMHKAYLNLKPFGITLSEVELFVRGKIDLPK